MDFLGKRWEEVYQQLLQDKTDFTYEITYPAGKAVSSGNLRVARLTHEEKELKFVLLHDRFNR